MSDYRAAVEQHGSVSAAARALGIPRGTLRGRLASGAPISSQSLEFSIPLDTDLPIEELIERRIAETDRVALKRQQREATVRVSSDEPIGIVHFGDPHLDDPGCDLRQLKADVRTINATPGMYGANIGDTINNWVGRLKEIYAKQETTEDQAWRLVEWFATEVKDWLYWVDGNHDLWNGGGRVIDYIHKIHGRPMVRTSTMTRLQLQFPSRSIRICARHSFPGRSQWNPTHGQLKAGMMQYHDDIIIAGHDHQGGYQMVKHPATDRVMHLIALGAYKVFDSYADELGLMDKHISPSAVTIIDPRASSTGLVHVMHSVQEAAEYLTWRRARG